MKKKILSSLLGLLLGGALLAGCGTPSVPSVEPVEKVTAVPQATQEAVQEAAPQTEAPAAVEAEPEAAPQAEAPAAVEAEPEAAPQAEAPAAVEAEPEAAPQAEAPAAVEAEPEAAPQAEALEAEPEAAEAAPDSQLETAAETEQAAPAETEAVETEQPAQEEAVLPEGQMYSYLTGEAIDKEIGEKRPFAVMINNLEPAVPQSGIVNADILYEMFVESDITRLMAVFQDPSGMEKIGPVRSSRHNYLSLADDNEAVYAHFGWSIFAEALINEQGRTTINGMFYDGSSGFFRTSDRVAPHNAYVTGDGLLGIAESLGIDRSYPEGYEQNLHFNRQDTQPAEGGDATEIHLAYPVNNPWFEYNPDDQLYYRFEYGAPHVDMETGEQLKFKNVLVQYTDHDYVGDTYLLEIHLIHEGDGRGVYFTDGKAVPFIWRKESWEDRTHYYTMDGQPLMLNPGKTMIQIIPESYGISY